MEFDVNKLPELYAPDIKRIELAKARQSAVWKGETPDRWPIVLTSPLTDAQKEIPNPDFKEAFYDIDLMLCSQIRNICTAANSNNDTVSSIRDNFGTGPIPTYPCPRT